MRAVKTPGLLGTGVIGAGWAARALHFGIDVVAADVKPEMEAWLPAAVANAEPALARLTLAPLPPKGALSFTTSLGEIAARADFIQENIPEQLDLKQRVLAEVSQQAAPDVQEALWREILHLVNDGVATIQQVLREHDVNAGSTLRALEARLYADAARAEAPAPASEAQPLRVLATHVRPEWIDYNGHMSESRYLQVFGDAMDALYRRVGVDETYRAASRMLYTVESHLLHMAEARVNEPLQVTTQVLALDDKRLHVFHRLYRTSDATLLATAEQMHVHVDTTQRMAAPIEGAVRTWLGQPSSAHASLPVPPQMGRHVGPRIQ